MITIAKGLTHVLHAGVPHCRFRCQPKCQVRNLNRVNVPTCDYIPILSEWASCMLKKRMKVEYREDKKLPELAHSDSISTLSSSSDGLVPKSHHTSALVHQSRPTADTVYTMHDCSPEEDR